MQRSHSPSAIRVPPPFTQRSLSTSTTTSASSNSHYMGQTPHTSSPRSYNTPLSPVSVGLGMRSVSGDSSSTRRSSWDEVDKLGYTYSLRVALLHEHLSNPPPSTSPSSRFSVASSSVSTPPLPPLPSPTLHGTSPSGSRFTFSSFGAGSPRPPETGDGSAFSTPSATPSPGMNRRKSAFGLRQKKDSDVLKIPKEFLVEFWTVLASEDGDEGWTTAVAAFLGSIKKGTKTPSGLNLREIPVLLETFTSLVPPAAPTCAATHQHQSHFLHLIQNYLPRSSHFSPIARPQSEKDRDLLFRLRAEIQTYMLSASPDPNADLSASGFHSPPLNNRKTSSPSLGVRSTSPATGSQDTIKRKPSPVWTGDGDNPGSMVDTVGLVWGVAREALEKDMYVITKSGPLDQLYLTDLKRMMSALSSLPPPLTSSQKNRQNALSEQMSHLLSLCPDLRLPGTPDLDNPSFADQSTPAFFIPNRKGEVFGRLTVRASESGLSTRTRDLVEQCRNVWGISSRREKEKEVESLVQRWTDSIGTREEGDWTKSVVEGVRDLCAGMNTTDPLPPVLSDLLETLLEYITTASAAIFPTTDLPPRGPPLSVLPILDAGAVHFLAHDHAAKLLEDTSDELKGGAVGEYVAAVGEFMGGMNAGVVNANDIAGFEKVAKWIEKEISNVKKVWGRGIAKRFDPASIILSRQLPLFLAELQALDRPTGNQDMFGLFETVSRLLGLWEELCPGQEHGFELDAFFEPHVLAWLKQTEDNTTQEWVSRAVGMDSWVPEGANKHSQSVIDLFEFIRGAAQIVLQDLPLSEYKRAVYIIDLSKTVSIAVTQYASTVSALFSADMNPAKASTPTFELNKKIEGKFGGKAGSWLAKGQQAVKSLEKKKADGFVIPPAACVKLTDMGAAQVCIDDLIFALEADDTARIVKENKVSNGAPDRNRHIFSVSVMRAEGLLTKGLGKAADGFAVVVDRESGERLLKTRTVLGTEDPRWEQSLEISVGRVKSLEISVFDRSLVGKHEAIGSSTFKLDPRSFAQIATRDVILPLSPRGAVHLRISMEGGEKHDVAYHLSTAGRALDRAESDMIREIGDRMGEFTKTILSATTLNNLTRPLKDKKKPRSALIEGELEASLGPLFEYFNENFSVFSVTLTSETRVHLMLALWHRTVDVLISLLIPPLSDRPYTPKDPLGSAEIDVVFKWLQVLKAFFNAEEGGIEHGVPISKLHIGNYKDLIMLGQYLDLPTPALKERCSAAVKNASANARSQTLNNGFGSLTLGNEEDNERMAEVLLRIARTRPDMSEFLGQQIGLLTRARIDRQAGVL